MSKTLTLIYQDILNNKVYKFRQGLGSPVFDKLEAEFAKAVLSLPASKGFEIGSGFSG